MADREGEEGEADRTTLLGRGAMKEDVLPKLFVPREEVEVRKPLADETTANVLDTTVSDNGP